MYHNSLGKEGIITVLKLYNGVTLEICDYVEVLASV